MTRPDAAFAARPDNGADRLHDRAASYVANYLAGSVERDGRASMGIAVTGALTGVYRFLMREVGPEAAYSTLQRAADDVIQECSQPPPR